LARKKETRKRNLNFHLPIAISFSSNTRILQNDPSYVTFGDIYDRHCEESGISREDPILLAGEKVKQVLREFRQAHGVAVSQIREDGFIADISQATKTQYLTLKKEILDEVSVKLVPDDTITRVNNYLIPPCLSFTHRFR
jgi:transformation/transcription domain-associated protein